MRPRYEIGDVLRVTRNVRNDGTFPGSDTGELLVRRGSVGHVVDVGTFLQDQIIYTVHFLDIGRQVGCREEELMSADDPWVPSRFEVREKVRARITLAVRGEVRAEAGAEGEIFRVVREVPGQLQYQVIFHDRVLQVPESALMPLAEAGEVSAS